MHNYHEVKFKINPCNETITDLLAAFLADEGFESFVPEIEGLTAYIRSSDYIKSNVEKVIQSFPIEADIRFEVSEIVGEDWNKEWEQNYFQPIEIEGKLVFRSSFHPSFPDVEHEIIIDPKMAFGTGHHSTTAGMSRMLLKENMKGKTVIDMGTGTGILSILSKKLGSGYTVGIDIDPYAIENAIENGKLNSADIEWITGDDKALDMLKEADIFLANINLNVIKNNLKDYLKKLKKGGRIMLSGFLIEDRDKVLKLAEENALTLVDEITADNWLTLKFEKLEH